MKHILLIVMFLFSLSITAQSKEHVGKYKLELGGDNHYIKHELTLNQDGTFFFHHYDKIQNGIPQERNFYAKGNWKSEKKLIYFSTKTSDFDKKYTLDFNNSKARFVSKSPRDKSARVIKTSIQFYKSEIFWMKTKTLIKID